MRWWIAVNPRTMAIDNVGVNGMDLTILPSNTRHIQWIDGRGEAEYNDRPALREIFFDVEPYVPLFQQFMTKLDGLTLKQAKTIQIDLINELYELKRQAPYHYAPAAGSYDWEATDDAVTAMSCKVLPALIGSSAAGQTSLVSQINANIVNPGNALIGHVNSTNSEVSISFSEFNAYVLGSISDGTGVNTINSRLQRIPISGDPENFNAPLGLMNADLYHLTHFPYSTALAFSPVGTSAGSTVAWIPLNQAAPVTLTLTEMGTLMNGIATRRQSLETVRFNKRVAVNALTTVEAVIAYDVIAGWP